MCVQILLETTCIPQASIAIRSVFELTRQPSFPVIDEQGKEREYSGRIFLVCTCDVIGMWKRSPQAQLSLAESASRSFSSSILVHASGDLGRRR